jgi:hypothetical protein
VWKNLWKTGTTWKSVKREALDEGGACVDGLASGGMVLQGIVISSSIMFLITH